MKLLRKWALLSGSAICLAVGCSHAPTAAPTAHERSAMDENNEPDTPATPNLKYEVLSTDESGNRTVEVAVTRSVTETRVRTFQNEQGQTVEEAYEHEIPIEEMRQVIVPAGDDVAEAVKRIQQGDR